MQEFTTPMMKQYVAIKEQYKDCLLFFRLGDFYELFMEDAHIGAQVLGITLTGRPKGKDGRIPMAGVPFHAVDSYISKLVKAGYKVAICEQITEPNKKGIVEREVVRVVTPGTLLDERALEGKENNYICAINQNQLSIALVYCDITTGAFWAQQFSVDDRVQILSDQLTRTRPAECLLPPQLYSDAEFLGIVRQHKSFSTFAFQNWEKYARDGADYLKKHFAVSTLASFNITDKPLVIQTAAALLGYLKETQKNDLAHIRTLTLREPETFVHLDRATIINLELFSTIRDRETTGSFLSAIDKTTTAMGGRMLKSWILQPLTSKPAIEARLSAVDELVMNRKLLGNVRSTLQDMNDLERILSRVTIGIGNARDLTSLATNMRLVFSAKHLLVDSKSSLLQKSQKSIATKLWNLVSYIEASVVADPPIHVKDGGIIQKGVNARLDELKEVVTHGKTWISNLETQERKRTGINSLKLRFNKVFGFYIEVSNSNLNLIPDNYIRKQTLVNGERFITPELKEKEELILKSEDEMKLLEYTIYKEIVEKTLLFTPFIQKAAESIATLDCLASNATLAYEGRYAKPTIVYSQELRIKDGRHPVVENAVGSNDFIPNSITFGPTHASMLLVTGPNMAGKSVYLRQTAIIVLLALMGSFVPAKSAQVSIVDAIFVRSGASDVIASGLSTFMLEMVETAYILHHATSKSLIVMDEIGRGTSTYDGVSIAWSIAEYMVKHFNPIPKTVFATHYFELTDLEAKFPGKIKNIHMAIHEEAGNLTFLHSVKDGSAEKSFGVAVAALAGMPTEVIDRANQFLTQIEQPTLSPQLSSTKPIESELIATIQGIDINNTTPLDAFEILAGIKKRISTSS